MAAGGGAATEARLRRGVEHERDSEPLDVEAAISRWRTTITRHRPSTTWPSCPRSRVNRAMSEAWTRSCSNRTRSSSGKAARTC
jgi:hypothetical protein